MIKKLIMALCYHPLSKPILWLLFYIILIVVGYGLWNHYAYQLLGQKKATTLKQLSQTNRELKSLKATRNIQASMALTQKSLLSPTEVVQYTREALLGQSGITLVSLTQEPAGEESVSRLVTILNSPYKRTKLHKYEYEMKLLSNYPSFLATLQSLRKIKGVYWESAKYTVKDYPNALVELKFYSLSKE